MVTEIRSETTDLDEARRGLLDSLDGLPDIAFDQPNVIGTWSIRACIAHLIAWDNWILDAMNRAERGEEIGGLPAEHAINDFAPARWEHFQISELLRSLEQARAALRTRMRSLSDADRARVRYDVGDMAMSANDVVDALIRHDDEHAGNIRAWRKTSDAAGGLAAE